MAYQLAYSIKANEDIQITLISNNHNFLTEDQKKTFDSIVSYEANPQEYLRTKTKLYELSPYDETIYLDVDMLALNNKLFSTLFDELKDIDFTMATRGATPYEKWDLKTSMWGDLSKLKDKHKGAKWYQLSSEFIYFKKTKEIKKLFKVANDQYDKVTEFNKFGNVMADEFAFGLSCCINNIYPHKETFTPICWAHAEKRSMKEIDPYINDNYYGYSMGGKHSHPQQQAYYLNMLKYYQMRTKKRIEVFIPKSKNYYLPERHTI